MTRLVLCIAFVAFALFIVGGSVLMAFGVSAMREFAAVVGFFAFIVWLVIKAEEEERRATRTPDNDADVRRRLAEGRWS